MAYFVWEFEGHGDVQVEYEPGKENYEIVGPDGSVYFLEIEIDENGEVELIEAVPAGY